MGSKILGLFILFCLTLVFNGCKKDKEEEEYGSFPLSENAKGWFTKVQDANIIFKSTNGLTDEFHFTINRTTPDAKINGVQGNGEEYNLECRQSLGGFYFRVAVTNKYDGEHPDEPEHIELEHYGIASDIEQWFLTNKPYKEIWFYYYFEDEKHVTTFEYIGDTIINNKKYKDVFRDRIQIFYESGALRINGEIYISKTLGLVAYKTTDAVTWYRE